MNNNLYRTAAKIAASCFMFLVIPLDGNSLSHHMSRWTLAAYAQTATATFNGAIVDESDAAIVGAIVKVTNTGTGLKRQATSDSDGLFTLPMLPPGNYTVEVKSEGFAPIEINNLTLEVGDQIARKIRLKVGKIGESVIITSGEGTVRESVSVGTVVNRQFVEKLPLNGRSFQSLIELTPGVVPTVTAATEQGQFSVNGQRANANYFMVDGVSANVSASASNTIAQNGNGSLPALSAFGSTNNLVSIDALQEFRVLTSTYAPEYGRTPGAQISIVTRSGTNSFHGALFNYFRNDVFDANDWFANATARPKPPLRQNDFGGTLGGPLLLPRFGEGGRQPWYNGRDRTFFFFSYEGLRLRQPKVGITDVPSLTLRQSAPVQLQPYLNAFPRPNGPENAATSLAKFSASYSNPSTLNATSIRLDHTLSSKSTLFGRYNHAPSQTISRGATGVSLNTLNQISSATRTITMGYTFIPTPNVSNELRFNYSRARIRSGNLLDGFGGAVAPNPSSILPSTVSPQELFLAFTVESALTARFLLGNNVFNMQRQFNIVDNISKVSGAHSMKFGVDYRRLNPYIGPNQYSQFVTFANRDRLIAGLAKSVFVQSSAIPREPIFTNLSLYGQDTWHASSRFTATYGVRWEYNPPPTEANGNQAFTVTGLDNPAGLDLAPRGTPLYKTTYNNIAPRVGLSYHLFGASGRETVIRGGAGLFYDLASGQISSAYGPAFGFGSLRSLSNVSFPLNQSLASPLPASTSPPITSPMTVADPNLKLPYTLQWNFALEQSLDSNQTISATYAGAVGRRLLRNEVLVAPNSNFSPGISLFVIRNGATSDYHALQLQYQRRLSRGLQALASYTWSHSIDDISVENPSARPSPAARTLPNQDRGSSDFDVRHNFAAAVTYDLPLRAASAVAAAVLRNWSVDTIIKARSATPVNLIAKIGRTGSYSTVVRPDLIPGVPIYIHDASAPGDRVINRSAFATPPGEQGTLGRNVIRGFPFFQTDLTLRRQFNLREHLNLQFRVDFFNISNHPNFANPVQLLTDLSNFGKSTAMFGSGLGQGDINGGFNPLYQSGGPRSLQFSLKLQF